MGSQRKSGTKRNPLWRVASALLGVIALVLALAVTGSSAYAAENPSEAANVIVNGNGGSGDSGTKAEEPAPTEESSDSSDTEEPADGEDGEESDSTAKPAPTEESSDSSDTEEPLDGNDGSNGGTASTSNTATSAPTETTTDLEAEPTTKPKTEQKSEWKSEAPTTEQPPAAPATVELSKVWGPGAIPKNGVMLTVKTSSQGSSSTNSASNRVGSSTYITASAKEGATVTLSETALTTEPPTDLDHYTSTLTCSDDVTMDANSGTAGSFTVPDDAAGLTIHCKFTNTWNGDDGSANDVKVSLTKHWASGVDGTSIKLAIYDVGSEEANPMQGESHFGGETIPADGSVKAGSTIALMEDFTGDADAQARANQYSTTLSCTADKDDLKAVAAKDGTGYPAGVGHKNVIGTYTIPDGASEVACTFTNTWNGDDGSGDDVKVALDKHWASGADGTWIKLAIYEMDSEEANPMQGRSHFDGQDNPTLQADGSVTAGSTIALMEDFTGDADAQARAEQYSTTLSCVAGGGESTVVDTKEESGDPAGGGNKTVMGMYEIPEGASDVSCVFTNTYSAPEPSVQVSKSVVDGSGVDVNGKTVSVGDELKWIIAVENTGSVAYTGDVFSDDVSDALMGTDLTLPVSSLTVDPPNAFDPTGWLAGSSYHASSHIGTVRANGLPVGKKATVTYSGKVVAQDAHGVTAIDNALTLLDDGVECAAAAPSEGNAKPCATHNPLTSSSSVELTKQWLGGIDGDEVGLTITGPSVFGAEAGSSTAPHGTDAVDAIANAAVGSEVTLDESFTTGDAKNYLSSVSCYYHQPRHFFRTYITPDDGVFTVPASAKDKTIRCSYTNTLKPSWTVELTKGWENGIDGDEVGLTITGPGVVDDEAGSSTVHGATDAATANAVVGSEVTLGESFTNGESGNYNSDVACYYNSFSFGKGWHQKPIEVSDDGGFTVPKKLALARTIFCTYTNTLKAPETGGLTITKSVTGLPENADVDAVTFSGTWECTPAVGQTGAEPISGRWSVTGAHSAKLTDNAGQDVDGSIPLGYSCTATETDPSDGPVSGDSSYEWGTANVSSPEPMTNEGAEIMVTNPVTAPNLNVSKSVDVGSGSWVDAGDTLEYTLTFDNSAGTAPAPVTYTDDLSGVLDDATVTTAPAIASGAGLTVAYAPGGNSFTVVGTVAASDTVTVTYQVTVNGQGDGESGDFNLVNFLVPTGADTQGTCDVETDDLCTTNPVRQIEIDKSVTSTTRNSDGTWTITYDVSVHNPSSVVTKYNLDDELAFGSDFDIESAAATRPNGNLLPNWDGQNHTKLVSGKKLKPGKTHTYGVTVTATVPSGAFAGDDEVPPSAQCQPDEQGDWGDAGGFGNIAIVTWGNGQVEAEDNTPRLMSQRSAFTTQPGLELPQGAHQLSDYACDEPTQPETPPNNPTPPSTPTPNIPTSVTPETGSAQCVLVDGEEAITSVEPAKVNGVNYSTSKNEDGTVTVTARPTNSDYELNVPTGWTGRSDGSATIVVTPDNSGAICVGGESSSTTDEPSVTTDESSGTTDEPSGMTPPAITTPPSAGPIEVLPTSETKASTTTPTTTEKIEVLPASGTKAGNIAYTGVNTFDMGMLALLLLGGGALVLTLGTMWRRKPRRH